jgi:hypothetical protein
MDEKIVQCKEKKIFMGTETRDKFENWKITNELESNHQMKCRLFS